MHKIKGLTSALGAVLVLSIIAFLSVHVDACGHHRQQHHNGYHHHHHHHHEENPKSSDKPVSAPPKSVWDNLENIITKSIASQAFPGAVLLVASKNSGIIYSNSFGHFTYNQQSSPMTIGSKFDMASCTKVLATTSATALLYQKGLIGLKDRVIKYYPAFAVNGKSEIMIENLLLHNAGLPPDPNPGYSATQFGCPATSDYHPPQVFTCASKIFNSWLNQVLENKPGQVYVYSDLSMISMMYIIGNVVKKNMAMLEMHEGDLRVECVQQVGGIDAPGHETCYYEAFVNKHVLQNLQMTKSGFIPKPEEKSNIPPTWLDTTYRHELIQGYVSDENGYALGGIAGHAGLFTPVVDVYRLMNELMFRARGNFINETTFDMFTTVKNTTQSSRALGWDTNSQGNGTCGSLSKKTFLHLGFTGTQVCGDPDRNLFTVFLTNRVYPDKDNNKMAPVRNAVNSEIQRVFDQYYH
ncbi:predicted protein [Naegleria gruberi]|uniref:Predicted protein n=1 Tax=Naegleria gruberi TaxID=5762 RepID=D2VG37_NAEGR|nr:uncharacterized protein NAEGRDRAFT_36745 [Naegleria gruberi]EFC44200.1 predicted protein [Naegleria gruberi]|eukprot:XP_002676944.1 predicted protein [Naegleria gruberi strain NEG-M]